MEVIPEKFYINTEVMTVYWMEGDALAFAPIMKNGTFTLTDSGIVDEDLVSDEHIYAPETEDFTTLGDIFAKARKALA